MKCVAKFVFVMDRIETLIRSDKKNTFQNK